MTKQIIYNENQLLDNILKGAKKVQELITTTMGPGGRLVVFRQENNIRQSRETKDGAMVAKSYEAGENSEEEYGAHLIIEASTKMAEIVGDGSTTAALVTCKFLKAVNKYRKLNISSYALNKALNFITKYMTQQINNISVSIDSTDDFVRKIATVSSGDSNIGDNIFELFKKLGNDAMIVVDESKNEFDSIRHEEGYFFDRGYVSAGFLKPNTTEQTKNKIELDNPYILLFNKSVQSISQPLVEIFQAIAKQGRSLLIIGDNFDENVIEACWKSRIYNSLNVICVKAPGYGDSITEHLSDISTFTGATPLSQEELGSQTKDPLGSAKKVIITHDNTTILSDQTSFEKSQTRINQLENQLVTANEFSGEKLRERIGKLRNGIGRYNVGGIDENSVKEKKDRVDDAIRACTNAIKYGIVPGAGSEFLWILSKLDNDVKTYNKSHEKIGFEILKTILPEVTKKIIINDGVGESIVIINEIIQSMKSSQNHKIGYNVHKKTIGQDLLNEGVVNPSQVAIKSISIGAEIAKRYGKCGALLVTQANKNS